MIDNIFERRETRNWVLINAFFIPKIQICDELAESLWTLKNSIKYIRKNTKNYVVRRQCGKPTSTGEERKLYSLVSKVLQWHIYIHITTRLPYYAEEGNHGKNITSNGNIPIIIDQYSPNHVIIFSSILAHILQFAKYLSSPTDPTTIFNSIHVNTYTE